MGAEAVVLLRDDIGDGFKYRRKQAMQLASKMRYISAQLEALLSGDLWERSRRARQRDGAAAGRRRARPARRARSPSRSRPTRCSRCSTRRSPSGCSASWPFYVWDEDTGEVRWMASWDTAEEEVDAFAADVRAALS